MKSNDEIMSGIEKVYVDIENIAEYVKMLNVDSVEMKKRVKVFLV